MNSELYIWEVIGVWASAFATVLVVFVALWLQHWYRRNQQPCLLLEYDRNRNDDNRYVYLGPKHASSSDKVEFEEFWIRLRVINQSHITARDVELRLIATHRENSPHPESRPSWSFKISNVDRVVRSIPPRFPQHFDLAYLKHNWSNGDDVSAFLVAVRFDMKSWAEERSLIEAYSETRILPGWEYAILTALTCDNAEAQFFEIRLKMHPSDQARHMADDSYIEHAMLGEDAMRKRFKLISIRKLKPSDLANR